MKCSFSYHGGGTIRRVMKGCGCTKAEIKGNVVHLTFTKRKAGSFVQVPTAEVVNGKVTLYPLKVRLNVTKD